MVETEYHGTLCFCRAGCRCAKHKNRREARRVHMNDDTVPDGGMAVGLDGGRTPSKGLKTLFFGLTLLLSLCAKANVETVNGIEWKYQVINEEAVIQSGGAGAAIPKSTTGPIEVPAMLGGYPVTEIGEYAFRSCESITEVTIPDGIATIGKFAFFECSSLTSVDIPDSVTRIRDYAFAGCSLLYDKETIPSAALVDGWAVSLLTDEDLKDCLNLHDIRGIVDAAFKGRRNIKQVSISGDFLAIGREAFSGCRNLEQVNISGVIRRVDHQAFYRCMNLVHVKLPSFLSIIEEAAFQGCASVTNFALPVLLQRIGENAFKGCDSITEVKIPASVKQIGDGAFSSCNSLTKFSVPEGNKSYDHYKGVLYTEQCRSLVVCPGAKETVVISPKATNIMDSAFADCTKLTEVEIGTRVKRIGISAFEGCTSLTNVMFSEKLKTIEDMAFGYCSSLEEINIPSTNVVIDANAFISCPALARVFLIDAYAGPTDVFPSTAEIIRYSSTATVSEGEGEGTAPTFQSEIAESADARLRENIKTEADYASFLSWVERLPNTTLETVKASPHAWLSYAMDSGALATAAPADGDVRIVSFVPVADGRTFDMAVSVAGMAVGNAATAANLSTLFTVEGASSPNAALFSTAGTDAQFSSPANGNVMIRVAPSDKTANNFFLRVRMK